MLTQLGEHPGEAEHALNLADKYEKPGMDAHTEVVRQHLQPDPLDHTKAVEFRRIYDAVIGNRGNHSFLIGRSDGKHAYISLRIRKPTDRSLTHIVFFSHYLPIEAAKRLQQALSAEGVNEKS